MCSRQSSLRKVACLFCFTMLAHDSAAFSNSHQALLLGKPFQASARPVEQVKIRPFVNNNFDFFPIGRGQVVLCGEKKRAPGDNIQGTGARGQIIFAIVLSFCIWLFSIPVEFRRAYICTSPRCVINRKGCNDCKTLGELREGVTDYYRNGGGVQFDFSIEKKD